MLHQVDDALRSTCAICVFITGENPLQTHIGYDAGGEDIYLW